MNTNEKAQYYRKESDYYQKELEVLKKKIEKTRDLLEILFNDKLPDFRRVQAEVKLKAMIKEL